MRIRHHSNPSGTIRLASLPAVLLLVRSLSAAPAEPLVHEGVVTAPIERVWAAMTSKEGIESWMAPHAEVDLRIGGKMRTNYRADGVLGDGATIENTILAFEPQHMLTIKATRPPDNFKFKRALEDMWTVVYFDALAPDRTRVRVVGMGFSDDEESQQMRKHFEAGNAWTLRKLQERFTTGDPPTSDSALVLARRLIGGEWFHEHTDKDQKILRALNVFKDGPDGKSVIGQGWLGAEDGMYCHGQTQIWQEPGTNRLLFQNINEKGNVARGELRCVANDTLEWDWDAQAPSGDLTRYRVHTAFQGSEAYRMQLLILRGNDWQELFNIPFQRAAEAPEQFKKPRAPAGG